MMRRYLRVLAALVVVAVGVSSAARLACADECASHEAAVPADSAEHCHHVETTESASLGSVVPEGCSPLSVRDFALRERPNEPIRTALLAVAHLPVRDSYSRLHTLGVCVTERGRMPARVFSGAILPLRI